MNASYKSRAEVAHSFASDNNTGIHPLVLEKIQEANQGQYLAYGDDPWTEKARQLFCEKLGRAADILFFLTGTGANVVAMAAMLQSWEALIAPWQAHLNEDECGAPEKFTGSKIITVKLPDGKLGPEDVAPFLIQRGDVHRVQPRAVSITQSSEFGRVYSLEEIRRLADFLHKEGLYLHVDGARLANACAALNCGLKEMITGTGVDIVSFGGTKNGLFQAEALLVLNENLKNAARFLQKQAMQLPSKMRFVAAQFVAYLEDDLWLRLAGHANRMAMHLAAALNELPRVRLAHPVEANAVFVYVPAECVEALRAGGYFYLFDETSSMARLMCNYDTTPEDIQTLVEHWRRTLA